MKKIFGEKPVGNPARWLIILGSVSWLVYAIVVSLSSRFAYGQSATARPTVEVLILLVAAFLCYLVALRVALGVRGGWGSRSGEQPAGDSAGGFSKNLRSTPATRQHVLPVILLFAGAFRLLFLFSQPILEIDYYRYLWDGQAVLAGVSPYAYSPQQVRDAASSDEAPADLVRLVEARDASPAVATILSRVHYADLATVYPPVSQSVFALATLSTPASADVSTRVVILKAWLLAFDLATLGLLILLLRYVGLPDGWSLAYGWCPLVLKEFANSGHLDAIAVCFTTLAVYCAVRGLMPPVTPPPYLAPGESPGAKWAGGEGAFRERPSGMSWLLAASVALALGVGAKLYPVVLAPLLLVAAARRLGVIKAFIPVAMFLLLTGAVCWPMLGKCVSRTDHLRSEAQTASAGLTAFLSRWEMNDFLFMLLEENLNPANEHRAARRTTRTDVRAVPWFVVTPAEWRQQLVFQADTRLPLAREQIPFFLARLATGVLFGALALWWAVRGARQSDGLLFTCSQRVPQESACSTSLPSEHVKRQALARRWLEAGFLTLAWFWLLLPTQNPWYWIWALPLIPFARSRAWLAVGGLVFLYYLRFWLGSHWPDKPVLGSGYHGPAFFDYVVVWIEFAPWFFCLTLATIRRRSVDSSRV